MNNAILTVENLKKYFPIGGGFLKEKKCQVKAVDGISFNVQRGETFGIVGESGCGKSTLGRTILNLLEPTDGRIIFQGKNINSLNKQELRKLRRDMQIVFQDPYASLNGRMKISYIIREPMMVHRVGNKEQQNIKVRQMLEVVGLNNSHADKYPHEFSGGQRQRIGIARALVLNPKLIVCDEPVSALDVSIQSQILNLLKDLQTEFELTYIFISHDLSVVRHISDRIAVMYLGKIVELTDTEKLFENPLHPYTKALLSSIPIPKIGAKRDRIILEGDVPSPIDPPKGCRFSTRCPIAEDVCQNKEPLLYEFSKNHYAACHKIL